MNSWLQQGEVREEEEEVPLDPPTLHSPAWREEEG